MEEKDMQNEDTVRSHDRSHQDFINNLFCFRNVLIATAIIGILLLIYLM